MAAAGRERGARRRPLDSRRSHGIRGTAGGLLEEGGGRRQQDEGNHIKWNECDWTTTTCHQHADVPLVLDYTETRRKEARTRQDICPQRVFGGERGA